MVKEIEEGKEIKITDKTTLAALSKITHGLRLLGANTCQTISGVCFDTSSIGFIESGIQFWHDGFLFTINENHYTEEHHKHRVESEEKMRKYLEQSNKEIM